MAVPLAQTLEEEIPFPEPPLINSHLNRLPARGQQALQYAELLRLVEQRLICWPLAGNLFKWLLSVPGNEMFTVTPLFLQGNVNPLIRARGHQ